MPTTTCAPCSMLNWCDMIIALFASEDLLSAADMHVLHATKTVYAFQIISSSNKREVVRDILGAKLLVVIPDDANRHTPALLDALLVVRHMDLQYVRMKDYLSSLQTKPAGAHAASPTKHAVPAGQPINAGPR